MILLPSTRQRIAKVPLLFRAHDCLDEHGLFALSFGRKVYAVFTGTSHASLLDQDGRPLRTPHGYPRLVRGADGRVRLLHELGSSNLCTRGSEFDQWSGGGASVTINASHAPDDSVTGDLLTASGSTSDSVFRNATYTADAAKAAAIYLKAGSASASGIGIYDLSFLQMRHLLQVTWTDGLPTLSTAAGAGRRFAPVPAKRGWWRIMMTANSIIAANTNQIYVYPDIAAGTGSVYAWRAQTENLAFPTSDMPTAGSVVTRQPESLYFPLLAAGQASTIYVRGQERGTNLDGSDSGLASIADSVNPSFMLFSSVSERYTAMYRRATDVFASVASATVFGDDLDVRALLTDAGAVRVAQTVNNGAEELSALSGALGLTDTYTVKRFYLGSRGSVPGAFAFESAAVAFGHPSRDELRDLCEVG